MAFVENKFEDHSHHESRRLLHLVFEEQGHMKSCCFEKIHENQFERQGSSTVTAHENSCSTKLGACYNAGDSKKSRHKYALIEVQYSPIYRGSANGKV